VHELRTPLNAILGFSEVIRGEWFGPAGDPRYARYGGLIHDTAGHLVSLIDDLLDMTKPESGKMDIAPMRVSAAALRAISRQFWPPSTANMRYIARLLGGRACAGGFYPRWLSG
jgi:signal transduction histidine kinase